MPSSSPAPAAFSLFPSPNASKPPPQVVRNQTPLGRRSESRERRLSTTSQAAAMRAPTPQQEPLHGGRQTPQGHHYHHHDRAQTPQQDLHDQWPLRTQQLPDQRAGPSRTRAASPVLTQQPPVRNSIAKLPLDNDGDDDGNGPRPSSQGHLRSIFPTYNPSLPLDQQDYAPTQKSPTRIPRAVISRQSYHEGGGGDSPRVRSPVHSPLVVDDSGHRWARQRPQEPPAEPKPSSTENLRSFWKVANGWKASPSEGRVFCMKLSQEKDAPVYTLSSSTQPFYNIRLDPTSASARVMVTRHDPNKPYREPPPSSSGSLGGPGARSADAKSWHEALSTTMEEESRRHRPEDGLVAVLMPAAAMRVSLARPNDESAVMAAEREGARLVWDDDSGNYFLVHPAIATPFCVTVDRSPAWSRVEYTLEHHESPRHLAKLTRDCTGGGWLEIDTGLASKIEAFYVVDVAVTALVLVASADEKNQPAAAEVFEPPPLIPPPAAALANGRSSSSSLSRFVGGKKASKPRMEQFEIDVESQDDSLAKEARVKVKEGIDRLPFVLRVPAKLAKALFKCAIWALTVAFKCLKLVFGGCYKLVGSKY